MNRLEGITPIKNLVEIYQDNQNKYRWRILRANQPIDGNKLGASSEGYSNKSECIQNMKSVVRELNNWLKEHG